MMSRADRSPLAEWWRTIDRTTLIVAVAMMVLGLVISLAASPPVADRLGIDPYHFVLRQAMFVPLAIALMIAVSMLSARRVRRVAALVFFGGLALMLLALFVGPEVKGAQRWLAVAGFSLQPSELAKPAFVVLVAWLLAEDSRRPNVPGKLFAGLLLAVFAALLVAQPDLGQTLLVVATWGGLFFLAGLSWTMVGVLGGLAAAGALTAYFAFPHVASRIDRFLDPSSGDTYQVDRALESFSRGGWFGAGPGEGEVKNVLPDSHTDFVLAVLAEEFGVVACLLLLAVFSFIVLRSFWTGMRREDAFERLSIAGLATLFGVQAFINMGVNLQLLPAKGMTLPFLSYGGSSLLSVGLLFGFILSLSRRRGAVRRHFAWAPLGRHA